MPNTIHIPTPLRPFTDKKEAVEVTGGTVGELLADLTKKHEGLRKHLYADDGRLRNFVNVYLNDEDIRYLQKEKTPVKPGDSLSIVPSVAGGSAHRDTNRGPQGPRHRVIAGRDRALLASLDHAGGWHRRSAEAEGRKRALHRRGWPRIAGGHVSGGRRCGTHRNR
jgi:adenylyltransferase/sulfurtransferase